MLSIYHVVELGGSAFSPRHGAANLSPTQFALFLFSCMLLIKGFVVLLGFVWVRIPVVFT